MHDVCVSSRDDGLLDKMHGVCVCMWIKGYVGNGYSILNHPIQKYTAYRSVFVHSALS